MPSGNSRSNSSLFILGHPIRAREGQFSQGGPRPTEGRSKRGTSSTCRHTGAYQHQFGFVDHYDLPRRDVKSHRAYRVLFLNPIRSGLRLQWQRLESWRLRSHYIALCGFRTCALLLIVMDFISYLNDASLILKGYMALEQGPKSLFFKGIYELAKRVCNCFRVQTV